MCECVRVHAAAAPTCSRRARDQGATLRNNVCVAHTVVDGHGPDVDKGEEPEV